MAGGAPLGNQNAVKAKRWQDAINRALAERSKAKGIEALDELAEKLLANAEAGDMTALKELGDRLDGRPAQSLTLAGDADNPLVTKITRAVVDPKSE